MLLLRLFGERFRHAQCARSAASLAFTTLLSLVPFITVAIVVTSYFPGFAELSTHFKQFLLENLLPDKAGGIIARYALQFSEKAANLTLIGTGALLVTAISMLLTIDETFNHIWGVRPRRALFARLSTYWTLLTVGPLLLAGSVLAASYLVSVSLGLTGDLPWVRESLLRLMPVGLLWLLFSLLYFAIPHTRVAPAHALAGGLVAALVFVAMQRGLGLYIARFPTYTLIYGTFAALPIFLLWLYLSWIVVLAGAILASIMPEFSERHRMQADYPGARAQTVVRMLCALAQAQQTGDTLTGESLAAEARQPLAATQALLESLSKAGWLIRTESERWALSRAAGEIRLADLIRQQGFNPLPWLQSVGEEGGGAYGILNAIEAALQHDRSTLADLLHHHTDIRPAQPSARA